MTTEQELRERVIKLFCKWCPQDCQGLTTEEMTGCLAGGGFAEEFLAFIKEAGYVQIRKDDIYWTKEQLSTPDWAAKYYKEDSEESPCSPTH